MLLLQAWALGILCVLAVSTSILGFCVFACRRFGESTLSFFAGFAAWLALLYSVGLLSFYNKPGMLLVLLSGWAALWFSRDTAAGFTSHFFQKIKWHRYSLWLVFPALYALARFFGAGLPQQHSDPLYYHLLGPKLWAQWGVIKVVEQHPSLVQATLWEAVYGLPQIFGTFLPPLFRNIVTQLYGQWMHFLWGQVACIVVAYRLLKKVTASLGLKEVAMSTAAGADVPKGKVAREQLVFFAWLVTAVPNLQWTSVLAKNDYLVLLFSLLAFTGVLEKRFFLSGIFAGFLFATKMTGFWTVGALLVLIPVRAWPLYAAGGLLGVLPNLVRSLVYTRNPVFPALDNVLGPGWISQGWNGANGTFIGPPALQGMGFWFWDQFLNMGLSKALFFLGVAGFLALCIQKRKLFFGRQLLCIGLQLFVALLFLKPLANGRYSSPIFALLLVYLIGSTLYFLANQKRAVARLQWALLGLGLLLNIPLDSVVKIPKQFWFEPADLYLKKFHTLYPMQEQINAVVPAGEPVFMATEKVNYYLDHDFDCTTEMKRWEPVFQSARSPKDIVGKAAQMGYRYFQYYPNDSKLFAGWPLPSGFDQYAAKVLVKHHDYVVLDLKK